MRGDPSCSHIVTHFAPEKNIQKTTLRFSFKPENRGVFPENLAKIKGPCISQEKVCFCNSCCFLMI
jgi:hypothetical protein